MKLRRFFLASMALATAAIGLHVAALAQISRSVEKRAYAVTVAESQRPALMADASKYSRQGAAINYIGFAFALSSVAFVLVSAWRHEPAQRIITFALLFIYLMLQLLLV